jgi:hypothetical protein
MPCRPNTQCVAACQVHAAALMCSPCPLTGRHVPSARSAGGVLAPSTFQSRYAIPSPSPQCAYPANCPVTVGNQFSTPPVCVPYRHVLSVHRAGTLLAPLPVWTPRAISSPCRRCTRTGNFPVATFLAGGIHSPPTFQSPYTIGSQRRWCTRPADCPLAMPAVFSSLQLYSSAVLSAHCATLQVQLYSARRTIVPFAAFPFSGYVPSAKHLPPVRRAILQLAIYRPLAAPFSRSASVCKVEPGQLCHITQMMEYDAQLDI